MTVERVEPHLPSWLQPGRRAAVLLITPLVVLVIINNIGHGLATTWARDHPLALITLNSQDGILLLTTNQLDPVSYYAVATMRRFLPSTLLFLLGMSYGDRIVRWIEAKSPTFGQPARMFERIFQKAAYPLVFFAPHQAVYLLAGAASMPVVAFVAVAVAGILARLWALRALGHLWEGPIDSVLDFFARYRGPLLALSVASIFVIIVVDWHRGRSGIGGLLELEHELAEEESGEKEEQT